MANYTIQSFAAEQYWAKNKRRNFVIDEHLWYLGPDEDELFAFKVIEYNERLKLRGIRRLLYVAVMQQWERLNEKWQR